MPTTLAIIVNKGSGKRPLAAKFDALKTAAAAHGLEPEFILVSNGEAAMFQARAAAERGVLVVAAAGGDGTLSAVANGIFGTNARLGILPLGTFNHFAADLNIPADIEGAFRIITEGIPLRVDVGLVNRIVFLNNSSIGLYPSIIHERDIDRARRPTSKFAAFLRALFKILRKYPTLALRINLEGREMVRRTAFVFVGNNEYILEGLRMGKRETMRNGRLGFGIAHRTNRWDLIRIFFKALTGRLKQESYFDQYSVTDIRLDSRKRFLKVSVDGEIRVLRTPIHYRILPQALTVMAPAAP